MMAKTKSAEETRSRTHGVLSYGSQNFHKPVDIFVNKTDFGWKSSLMTAFFDHRTTCAPRIEPL